VKLKVEAVLCGIETKACCSEIRYDGMIVF